MEKQKNLPLQNGEVKSEIKKMFYTNITERVKCKCKIY